MLTMSGGNYEVLVEKQTMLINKLNNSTPKMFEDMFEMKDEMNRHFN